VWAHRGATHSLSASRGDVRVRIVVRAQPVLAAVARPSFQSLVRPTETLSSRREAQDHPLTITSREKRAARSEEESFEAAVERLADEADSSSAQLADLTRRVEALGGVVRAQELLPAALIARVDARAIGRIDGLDGVQAVEPAPHEKPLSGVGTSAVGAPAWWTAGHIGGGGANDTVPADVAIQSEAADPSHPAFAGVTVDNGPDAPVTDHGTHTGGIIASRDLTYRGVAPGVDRLIGSAGSAYALGVTAPDGPGAVDPAETISVSFGSPALSDDEDDSDDVLTGMFGVGQAFAAGNENLDGTPTVNNIGRNILSVAAFNDVGTVTSTDDVVLGVSSRGPTPGGRKKPDLTAPGGAVIAPSADWNSPPSNPDFTGASGTSFSAPHVAGAMTLLEGAGIGDPMAQRAILINSARDWNGAATGLAGWTAPQTTWRPEVGWGELDLTAALAERGNYLLGSVRGGEAAFYRATVPTGAKATLAYELRGFFVGFPNPGTETIKYTQSNLDLRQYLASGAEVPPPVDPGHGGGPDAVDPNDTVEQVRAPAGGPQGITYKVEAASTVVGADAEPFAITSASPLTQLATPVVRPSDFDVDPDPVRCSEPVTITTALVNDSPDLEATDAEVELGLPSGVEMVTGAPVQPVSGGSLEAATTSEAHSWTVQATMHGPKTLTLSGTGEGLGTPFTRSREIELTADCHPPATAIDSGPTGPTRDETPTFAFSAVGGDGFECSMDGAGFAPCSSPLTSAVLGRGAHTFSVRARDGVGNVDPTAATAAFTIDRSLAGPKLRIKRVPKFKGALRVPLAVSLGEPGAARVRARMVIGRRATLTPVVEVDFEGAGPKAVVVRAPDPLDRRIARALGAGRRVKLRVSSKFEDRAGNRETIKRPVQLR
jgi:hypothetical protein